MTDPFAIAQRHTVFSVSIRCTYRVPYLETWNTIDLSCPEQPNLLIITDERDHASKLALTLWFQNFMSFCFKNVCSPQVTTL